MLKDFKAFLMRGNVVDLAVAVVIGAAFGAVVSSFVDNIINPIVGVLGGGNFDEFAITLTRDANDDPESQLRWGAVVTALIDFVLVAAAIFFVVIKPMQVIAARRARGEEPVEDTPAPSDEAVLLTEIRDLLRAQQ
jgi:large conductance mechanosensitive channel